FPIDDASAALEQIRWEYRHLRKADAVLFWFPCETLCPISLYELGAWSVYCDQTGLRPLFVGVHPQYRRRPDIEIQTGLVRPEVPIVYRVSDLAERVRQWVPSFKGRR